MSEKPHKGNFGESLVRRVKEKSKLKSEAYLGRGIEKRVYEHPGDDKKAVLVFHPEGVEGPPDHDEDGDEIQGIFIPHPEMDQNERNRFKRQFYLIKILRALFPEVIPDVHMVGTEPRFLIRELIQGTHPRHLGGSVRENNEAEDEALAPFVAALESVGLHVDGHGKNFLATKEGKHVYTDTFLIDVAQHDDYSDTPTEDIKVSLADETEIGERLGRAINERLEGKEKQIALKRLARYQQLLLPAAE